LKQLVAGMLSFLKNFRMKELSFLGTSYRGYNADFFHFRQTAFEKWQSPDTITSSPVEKYYSRLTTTITIYLLIHYRCLINRKT